MSETPRSLAVGWGGTGSMSGTSTRPSSRSLSDAWGGGGLGPALGVCRHLWQVASASLRHFSGLRAPRFVGPRCRRTQVGLPVSEALTSISRASPAYRRGRAAPTLPTPGPSPPRQFVLHAPPGPP